MSRSIVIIGGGIIGSSTAYYLTRHPKIGQTAIYLVESSYIAAGSSGKGGGFIAKDWHGSATKSLGELSFDLHSELAETYGGAQKWGYRRLKTLSIDGDARPGKRKKTTSVEGADWIKSVSGTIDTIGTEDTTAQVHPFQLTNALVDLAKERGVEVVNGEASGVNFAESGEPSSVIVTFESGEERILEATDVVFAAGPWTGKLARRLLETKAGRAIEIEPSPKSTSIVISPDPNHSVTPHALFCELVLPDGSHVQPEIYPRPDNTLYVCGAGMSDRTPLPTHARDVHANPEGVERLKLRVNAVVKEGLVSGKLKDDDFVKQACYRPDSGKTGLPLIGEFGTGLWIASGHQVWGISLGPGTGMVMAELMLDGTASSADVGALLPTKK